MSYSLQQAAEATSKDRSTIQRAIKSGKISAALNASGFYQIDPAELHRVFPPAVRNEGKDVAPQQTATDETASENRELKAKVELLREMVAKTESERDEWRDQCKRMTLLLSDQRQPPKAEPEPPPVNDNPAPRPVPPLALWLAATAAALAVGLAVWQAWSHGQP